MLARLFPLRRRGALIVLLAVTATLQVAWVIYAARPPLSDHDPAFYLHAATELASGHGYRFFDGQATAYYPVGYPAVLSVVIVLVRHTPLPDNLPRAAGGLNVVLGLANVLLVFHLARRLVAESVAITAAGVVARFPSLILHSAALLSETLFITLVLAALSVALWRPLDSVSRRRLAAVGVIIGLAALVRPPALLLPFPLMLALRRAGFSWPDAARRFAVVLGMAVVVLLPWTVRNALVFHAPVLVSTNIGDDLCIGHHPGAPGSWAKPASCAQGHPPAPRTQYEIERNRVNAERAVRFAAGHPVAEAKLVVKRAFFLVYHDTD